MAIRPFGIEITDAILVKRSGLQSLGAQIGGAHGGDQPPQFHRPKIGFEVASCGGDQRGQSHHIFRFDERCKQALDHQLLPLQPAEISFAVVAPAQKPLQLPSFEQLGAGLEVDVKPCLLYTSPSPRDATLSRMPSSA